MLLQKKLKSIAIVIGLGFGLVAATPMAQAITLIDNSTFGLYNDGIGTVLDGSSDNFPLADIGSGDPDIDIVPPDPAPDLSTASGSLGNWLTVPSNPGGTWSTGTQAIPGTWAVNTETAIIYEIEAGSGLLGVNASFGVDNGIFVWLDGTFLGGQLKPGVSSLGELALTLGNLSAGSHFLQILREDHGVGTDYDILVNAAAQAPAIVPLPAALPLYGSGLAIMGFIGWRRRQKNTA